VTATSGTEHLELVKGLGADRVINHTAQDFTKDTQRYDVVLDAVGKSSFLRCPLAQNLVLALVAPLLGGRKVWSTGGTGWTSSSRPTATSRRAARSATS
jgi:NADPH:quinone reductase-like Zn-dependent oxidoreductase